MQNPPSPIETLRQLKEMLDAGTITPTEFEALKQQLVFATAGPGPEAMPAAPAPEAVSAAASPEPTRHSPPGPLAPDWQQHPTGSPPPAETEPALVDELAGFDPPPARNPLNLILSIGGLLALLGLVVYLSFNNRPSEHLTSGSQTAADSVVTVVETGPQAEQAERSAAAPETVRFVPATRLPAPAPAPQAIPAATDSVDTAAPVLAADSVAAP